MMFRWFCVLLSAFLVIDLCAWIDGRQTLTQWVIANGRKDNRIKFLVLTIIMTAAVYLCVHLELTQ